MNRSFIEGPPHSLTVDVEDYFHAATLEPLIGPSKWHAFPSRVEETTEELLKLLSQHEARGTFFVLGCVARRFPHLVKRIHNGGHEVASHGYGHRRAYEQTPQAFQRDVRKSKYLLEDLIGERIVGYRAPNFSIIERNQWAYDELIGAGYSYDSSVYPTWHPRYANLEKPTAPFSIKRRDGSLLVFPLSVASLRVLGTALRVPVAGGAYWRFLPRSLLFWGLKQARRNGVLNCYLHPWDLDSEQPRIRRLPLLSRLRHHAGARSVQDTTRRFLQHFHSRPLREIALRYEAP